VRRWSSARARISLASWTEQFIKSAVRPVM
jgi:hypothetical protein